MFMRTTFRSSTYFVGVIFGIYIDKLESKKTDKVKTLPSWMKYTAIVTAVAAYVPLFADFSRWMSLEECLLTLSIFQPLHSLCYASFIGFIITLCRFGNSPLINKFLSARFFKTFSMLTFSIYMVNPIVKNHYHLKVESDSFMVSIRLNSYMNDVELNYNVFAQFNRLFLRIFLWKWL